MQFSVKTFSWKLYWFGKPVKINNNSISLWSRTIRKSHKAVPEVLLCTTYTCFPVFSDCQKSMNRNLLHYKHFLSKSIFHSFILTLLVYSCPFPTLVSGEKHILWLLFGLPVHFISLAMSYTYLNISSIQTHTLKERSARGGMQSCFMLRPGLIQPLLKFDRESPWTDLTSCPANFTIHLWPPTTLLLRPKSVLGGLLQTQTHSLFTLSLVTGRYFCNAQQCNESPLVRMKYSWNVTGLQLYGCCSPQSAWWFGCTQCCCVRECHLQ